MEYEAKEVRIHPNTIEFDYIKEQMHFKVCAKAVCVGDPHTERIREEFCEAVHDTRFSDPICVVPMANMVNKMQYAQAHADKWVNAKYPNIVIMALDAIEGINAEFTKGDNKD